MANPNYAEALIKNREADPLFTRREAANYLGVTEATLAAWVHHRRYNLPYVKIGRLVKYRKSDLDAFIESNRQNYSTAN